VEPVIALVLAIFKNPGYSPRSMAKLVFDIETTALPLEGFDAVQSEYLFRDAENLTDPVQRLARRAQIQSFFSLWPLTGQIVCIAMSNVDSFRSKVLFLGQEDNAQDKESELPASVEFVPCSNETELLTEFWEVAVRYETIVTFNGRTFDVPFIYLRSALLNVGISRKDWLGYRFQIEPHCDLLEQLTFYNVSGREGAARRFNLDFYCKAFGIPSPKSDGITGLDIGRLMAEGRARDVAAYCLGDVQATAKLYKVWKERLAGIT
jgi:DNA polymerase elongation subunit (family B)